MAGTQLAQNPNETRNTMKDQWEIQYSRFFSFPSLPSPCLSLRPLPRSQKVHSGGTWLSASSTASLHFINDHQGSGVVLIVAFGGKIYEEHYVSKLHFSWPQVSCEAECPIRGSRVVFSSYRDCVGKIQKFAMRFSASSDTLRFINSLKESLKDVKNNRLPTSDFGLEISSRSGFISSNGNYYSADEESKRVNLVGNHCSSVQPTMNYEGMQNAGSEGTVLTHDSEPTCETLPPSFTAFLSDASTEATQEPPKVPEEVHVKSQLTSLKDVMNNGLPTSDFGLGTSRSGFISSNGNSYRVDEESRRVNLVGNHSSQVQPTMNYEGMYNTGSDGTVLTHDSEPTCVTLPPIFTAFLSDSCTEAAQEPPKIPEEVHVKSQIMGYMTDSSFYDMLRKLEMVIDELGGDLAL